MLIRIRSAGMDGKIVKVRDELMAATRYAMMMLRKAKTYDDSGNRWKKINYGTNAELGIV